MADAAKPSLAALLVGKLGKKDEDEESGADMCAKDIIEAIHNKDHKALSAALKDFGAYDDDEDDVEGGAKSGEPGDAGAAARDPNKGYVTSYKG